MLFYLVLFAVSSPCAFPVSWVTTQMSRFALIGFLAVWGWERRCIRWTHRRIRPTLVYHLTPHCRLIRILSLPWWMSALLFHFPFSLSLSDKIGNIFYKCLRSERLMQATDGKTDKPNIQCPIVNCSPTLPHGFGVCMCECKRVFAFSSSLFGRSSLSSWGRNACNMQPVTHRFTHCL